MSEEEEGEKQPYDTTQKYAHISHYFLHIKNLRIVQKWQFGFCQNKIEGIHFIPMIMQKRAPDTKGSAGRAADVQRIWCQSTTGITPLPKPQVTLTCHR